MDDFVARAILRYQIDKASLAQTSSALKGAKADLVGIAGAAQALDKTYLGVANHMLRFSNNVEKNTSDLQKLRGELNGVAEASVKASKGLTLGKAESVLQRGGRALSGLGISGAGDALSGGADVLQLLNSAKEGLASLVPPVTAVGAASATASTGVAAMSAALVPLLPILLPLGALLVGVAVAVKLFSDELDKGHKVVQDALTQLDIYYEAIHKGTIQTLGDKLVELKELKRLKDDELKTVVAANAKAQVDFLKTYGVQAYGVALVAGVFKDLDEQTAKLTAQSKSYDNSIKGLERAIVSTEVKSRALADALMTELGKALIAAFNTAKGYAEAEKNFQDLRGKLADKQAADIIKENEDKAATDKAFANQQNQERAAASRKYNDAVARAEEQAATDQLNIQANYATKVADILQTALDAADTALARLQDRERELLTGASREDEKDARKQALEDVEIQVKARRTERDDLVSHLRKVREIQNASKSEERDALLDRNFLALFQLQENKKDQQTEEQQAYEDQKADRQQALADEAVDLTRQRNFERNERRIALQQQLSDARDGYVREIALARQKRDAALALAVNQRDAEIALASQKRIAVLSVLLDQYKNEISLANQSSQARQMILWAEIAQTKQMLASMGIYQPGPPTTMGPGSANPATLSTNTNKLRAFADGGYAAAGHPFLFNDKFPGQRESMNGVMLPQGMGVAIPYQSGRVDPGSGGGVMLSQTFQIDGSGNPEVTARTIARISRQELVKFLNESIG